MSLLCQNDVATLFWCNDDVIIASCVLSDHWLKYWPACHLVGAKPLPEPVRTYNSLEQTSIKFESEIKNFYRIKYKFFCKNDVHFMSALRCLFTCGVFTGWDEGMLTMRLGEVSLLTIEGFKGYGERGFPAWGYPWWNEILSTVTYIYMIYVRSSSRFGKSLN